VREAVSFDFLIKGHTLDIGQIGKKFDSAIYEVYSINAIPK
jgi:hypothetical protein